MQLLDKSKKSKPQVMVGGDDFNPGENLALPVGRGSYVRKVCVRERKRDERKGGDATGSMRP